MLLGELGAEGADGLHHHDLELVRDLRDEAGDLLHESIHAGLGPRLQEGRDCQRGDRSVGICRKKGRKNYSRVRICSFNKLRIRRLPYRYQSQSHRSSINLLKTSKYCVIRKLCLKLKIHQFFSFFEKVKNTDHYRNLTPATLTRKVKQCGLALLLLKVKKIFNVQLA